MLTRITRCGLGCAAGRRTKKIAVATTAITNKATGRNRRRREDGPEPAEPEALGACFPSWETRAPPRGAVFFLPLATYTS